MRIASSRARSSSADGGAGAATSASGSIVAVLSSVAIVSPQVGEVLVGPVFRCPLHGQFAERLDLLEGDRGAAVELEHGEEARDDDALLLRTSDELAKRHGLAATQQRNDRRGLLP